MSGDGNVSDMYRTPTEEAVSPALAKIFTESADSLEIKLGLFPRYARRSEITRFLALYELFKLCVPLKGSIVECGVFRGFSLMTWAHLSAVMEPNNLNRRIYGFDSFRGFPVVAEQDSADKTGTLVGDFASNSLDELRKIVEVYDTDRFLGHIDKVHLIDGDVTETIPAFVEDNKHLVIAMLFLDLDLYQGTKVALAHFLPRMHKGSVLVFDELDRPKWPGETVALIEEIGLRNVGLRRCEFDPNIAYAVLD